MLRNRFENLSLMLRRVTVLAVLALTAATTARAQPAGAKMLLKQFYVAFMRPVDTRLNVEDPKVRPILMKHLASIQQLEKDGTLFMAGPLRDGNHPEQWDGSGMIIVRAESIEQARAIFEKDPLVLAGLRKVEVSGWMLNEGSFQTTIRFSEAKVEVQ